jgi:hypothetical protein
VDVGDGSAAKDNWLTVKLFNTLKPKLEGPEMSKVSTDPDRGKMMVGAFGDELSNIAVSAAWG